MAPALKPVIAVIKHIAVAVPYYIYDGLRSGKRGRTKTKDGEKLNLKIQTKVRMTRIDTVPGEGDAIELIAWSWSLK